MHKSVKLLLGMLLLGAFVVSPVRGEEKKAAKAKPSLKAKQLLGDWNYVSGLRAGEEVAKERLAGKVTITKETFTLPGGPDSTFVMTYQLDAKKSPATIDLKIKSGPVPEGSTVGIIKVEKGKLTLCYDPQGAKRPTKFESTEENGAFMFVLKKAE